MRGVSFGDVVFILFVCGVIFAVMTLVNHSHRRDGGGETASGGEEIETEDEDVTP